MREGGKALTLHGEATGEQRISEKKKDEKKSMVIVSLRAHAASAAASPRPLGSNLGPQAKGHRHVVSLSDKDRQLSAPKRTKTVPFATSDGENIIASTSSSDAQTTSSSSDPENILAAFAASAAAAEEAALAAAFAGTGTDNSESAAAPAPAAAAESAAPPAPLSSSAPALPSSAAPAGGPNPALAAKIAAARAYKAAAAERAAKGDSNIGVGAKSSGASASVPPPAAAAAVARAPVAPAPAGPSFTRSTPPPPTKPIPSASSSSSSSSASATPMETRGLFEGAGSETEAAAFLKGVFDSSSDGTKGGEEEEKPLDPNMRAEEFTALKTARERARGAEIITVDAGANAAEGGGGAEEGSGETDSENNGYRPKVATWGVFPRPDNISKTYGGGRTIRPGDALESAEEKEARLKRQRAALESYRKKVGLVVDPRDEAVATRLVAVGNELMRTGALAEAAAEYERAAELLPARSAVGGRARLQRAICLDSMGKRDEAFALYKSVEGHPLDSIGKETKRMLFGFQAMEDLKAHTISYAPDKEAYAPFFGKLKSDWDTQYVSSEEEKSEGSAGALVAAVAVIAAPLLLFGALTTLGK